ncbi:13E12 repeat family protein, partial [Mycobacterium szulgai]
ATLEAVEAKLAAPGMCNRDDEAPVVDDEPSAEAARRDLRSKPQRFHDGLLAGLRALLMSGELGQHNGLPASIIVT